MATRSERERFIAIMQAEFPQRSVGEVLALCRSLMRNSATMARIAETLCSVEMSEREQARVERADDAAEARVKSLYEPWGIAPVFNGDPRGAVIKLKVPSGRTDDWGRTGVCVP